MRQVTSVVIEDEKYVISRRAVVRDDLITAASAVMLDTACSVQMKNNIMSLCNKSVRADHDTNLHLVIRLAISEKNWRDLLTYVNDLRNTVFRKE
ncbi:hypothetical protein CDAR_166621 [Caerostris darwini]|uniref:Uncharacterized protein n=1 Tax=Caerostris darwini TaxID=1538125 RepID=A0AAV4NB82_9ARAC|nr:hypothetical protein CDAR_166621 [Caerostris darwini]